MTAGMVVLILVCLLLGGALNPVVCDVLLALMGAVWRELEAIAKGFEILPRELEKGAAQLGELKTRLEGWHSAKPAPLSPRETYLLFAYTAFYRDYEADETLDKQEAVEALERAVEHVEKGGRLDPAGLPLFETVCPECGGRGWTTSGYDLPSDREPCEACQRREWKQGEWAHGHGLWQIIPANPKAQVVFVDANAPYPPVVSENDERWERLLADGSISQNEVRRRMGSFPIRPDVDDIVA